MTVKLRFALPITLLVSFLLLAGFPGSGGAIDLKKKVKKAAETVKKSGGEKGEETPEESAASDEATEAEAPEGGAAAADAESMRPGEGVWANYDFVPGDRVLFYDDYSDVTVGDFARHLEFMSGALEVVDAGGTRLLRGTSEGRFVVPLPETLPDRFTIEFDFAQTDYVLRVCASDQPEEGECFFTFGGEAEGIESNGGVRAVKETRGEDRGRMFHARIMADGPYMKVYRNEVRLANVPNSRFPRTNRLVFDFGADEPRPEFFGPIRVAAGGREILYDQIMSRGRVVAAGILFDTGSDRLRPESTPTLSDITKMMKDHADLKLGIEGHTDNAGNDDANQTLSAKRAESVRAWLTARGIAADRLTATGFGETRPAASNDTPEGRQMNRRVELVKL